MGHSIKKGNLERCPKSLSKRHLEMCLLLAKGLKVAEVAKQIGYHRSTVSRLSTYPIFSEQISHNQDQFAVELQSKFEAMISKALDNAEKGNKFIDILFSSGKSPFR